MKIVLKNSLLVIILAGLFFIPVIGFGFAEYKTKEQTQPEVVLGIADRQLVIDQVDQIDLELNLSDDKVQKFYNIIPEKYIGGDYKIMVIAPQKMREEGTSFKLSENELSADLTISFESEDLPPPIVNISIVIFGPE